jgi:hypothetical protein
MKIKNWEEFQHFKDRTPPWIKLYRYLLDDPEWHELSGDDSKILVMLWLIASEDKAMQGNLPNSKTLAFRLRITELQLNHHLTKLSSWLILDDNNVISLCYQTDAPEERQRREETECVSADFEKFYSAYPKKKNRGDAEKAWKSAKPVLADVLKALEWQRLQPDWVKDKGQFIPYPASYIRAKGWLDEIQSTVETKRGLVL